MSAGEAEFALQCKALGIKPEREYRFHPTRRWRFDFALVSDKIAIEIEGGIYTQGRHTRGKGFEADCEKYAEAVLLGWRVLRFSTGQVKSGVAISYLEKLMAI